MNTELDDLARQARACRLCRDSPSGLPLPHEPRPVFTVSTKARILIASQAPGVKVNESGKPFTDRSGDRLREWMAVSSEEFYDPDLVAILPMGFCFPGNDRHGGDLPPRRECAPRWRADMLALMPQIDLILLIGRYAQNWHLGKARGASLSETVGEWRLHMRRNIMPLPHPSWRNTAWLKRNPWFETELLPVLRKEIRDRISPPE
ncbi:MAG TPA: uracil-DNA glycosylase family protein [Rhizobiaceae bacterium]|nr:uracil-DNA glycosylase family protein [Rhizobiaceae bacterium]